MGEDSKGAGGIEANAFDGVDINMVLGDGLLNAVTNAPPNVRSGLFLMSLSVAVSFVLRVVIHSIQSLAAKDQCSWTPDQQCRPSRQ